MGEILKDLDLQQLTQAAVAHLKATLGKDIQFFAAAHEDQTAIRHVNALIFVPGRLSKADFRSLPKLLRDAAIANMTEQHPGLILEEGVVPPTHSPVISVAPSDTFAPGAVQRDDLLYSGTPLPPSCPSCGPTERLWRVEVGTFYCPGCGTSFEAIGPTGSLKREEVQLTL